MRWLIDTDIAIHLRDGDHEVVHRIAEQHETPALSLISLVELLGGAAAKPVEGERRRERLSVLLRTMDLVDFDPQRRRCLQRHTLQSAASRGFVSSTA